jgi:hypothetical protein
MFADILIIITDVLNALAQNELFLSAIPYVLGGLLFISSLYILKASLTARSRQARRSTEPYCS